MITPEAKIALLDRPSTQGASYLGETAVRAMLPESAQIARSIEPPGSVKSRCGPIVAQALSTLYPDETFTDGDYFRLHQYGMHAVENGTLQGTPALCLLESYKTGFFDSSIVATNKPDPLYAYQRAPHFLFHGSHIPRVDMAEVIETRVCQKLVAKDTLELSDPSCSHSYGSAYFPKIRSLLHHDHPDLRDLYPAIVPLVLTRLRNNNGVVTTFTYQKVIDRLVERCATGTVYVTPARQNNFVPIAEYADQQEVRTANPVRCTYAIRTSQYDLPGDLVVLDGPDDALWKFMDGLRRTESWMNLSRTLGITTSYLAEQIPDVYDCYHARQGIRRTDPEKGTYKYTQWPFFPYPPEK